MGILDAPVTPARIGAVSSRRVRRRLDLNNAYDIKNVNAVDVLLASPPTVAQSAANAATTLVYARSYNLSSAASSPVIAPFRSYAGHVRSGLSGANVNNSQQVTPSSQSTTPFYVDFVTDAPLFEIVKIGNNQGYYRVRVDGQLVSATPITSSSAGRYRDTYDFAGARKPRHIEIETANGFELEAVAITTADAIWKSNKPLGPRVVWAGDSYATVGNDFFAAIPTLVCRSLGWSDLYNVGVSGTGYVTPGLTTSAVKLRDRLAHDVDAYAPDVVVVAMGYNDTYFTITPAAVEAEALLCYQQIKANNPDAVLIVIGHMTPNVPTAAMIAMDTAITAAVTTAGSLVDLYIRPFGGSDASWIDNALQVPTYRRADGIHLSPAGAAMYAQHIGDAIRAAVPLGT